MSEPLLLRYAEVEKILNLAFDVAPDREKAFEARLRYMRKPQTGCIPGLPNAGQGKQIIYRLSHLRHFFLTLHLSRLGLEPKFIGRLYRQEYMKVDEWFDEGEKELENGWKLEMPADALSKYEMALASGKRGTYPNQFYVALEIMDFASEGAKGSMVINVDTGRGLEFFANRSVRYFNQASIVLVDFTGVAVQLNGFIKRVVGNGKN
ncbi:MAG: hypothetical protein IH995_09255 [Proteobacteria bacterium]|nr:hypothetical protein [Pseudomonadota bacterium]